MKRYAPLPSRSRRRVRHESSISLTAWPSQIRSARLLRPPPSTRRGPTPGTHVTITASAPTTRAPARPSSRRMTLSYSPSSRNTTWPRASTVWMTSYSQGTSSSQSAIGKTGPWTGVLPGPTRYTGRTSAAAHAPRDITRSTAVEHRPFIETSPAKYAAKIRDSIESARTSWVSGHVDPIPDREAAGQTDRGDRYVPPIPRPTRTIDLARS